MSDNRISYTLRIIIFAGLFIYTNALWTHAANQADSRKGGLCLQFDDGWTSWVTVIAPELAAVKGVATGFINNQFTDSKRISYDDIRRLQNEFGWQIGTHTYHHLHAPRYTHEHGATQWLDRELRSSLSAFRREKIHITSLVFPYNAYTPALAQAALSEVNSYRGTGALAMTDGLGENGSFPATPLDTAAHMELSRIFRWIDLAHKRNRVLFLFGHLVLPDNYFATATIATVSSNTVTVTAPIDMKIDGNLVLFAESTTKATQSSMYHVLSVEGKLVTISEPTFKSDVAPGTTITLKPANAIQLSEFRKMLHYASSRLVFYTVDDIASGKHLKD